MRRSCSSFLELVRSRPASELVGHVRLWKAAAASGTLDQLKALLQWRVQADAVSRLREDQSRRLTESARELARVRGLRRRLPEFERDGLSCLDCGNVQPSMSSNYVRRKVELRINGLLDVQDYCRALVFLWNLGK